MEPDTGSPERGERETERESSQNTREPERAGKEKPLEFCIGSPEVFISILISTSV